MKKTTSLLLCTLLLTVAVAQAQSNKDRISGTVILRCIFTSQGTVTHIRVVKGLPGGLTENAMEAARQIKFTPAIKDGKPVSMWIQLEYHFNLDND